MTKSTANPNKSERAEKREARRTGTTENTPYKMRSAASRRAEARARAAYRGAEDGMSGDLPDSPEPRIAVRDVGIRINLDAPPKTRKREHALDQGQIAYLLHNPTKTVTVETLRAQYNYVAADIRSMALLAAGLFALLIVLAFVLPR
ncbi:MAG: hypothetical protein SGJ24_13100 [Chloroflexota bacterium]|nr:hypothetical protein [Chloroflexota bacterium]